MKRIVFMLAASVVLAIPASSAFAAPHRTTGALPEELCFAATPWPAQPVTCGKGAGDH
jgi:hypothetical protein